MSRNTTCARLDLDPDVTRLVVLGDPHGDLAGVEEVYRREHGPGVVWLCVGDVVGKADGPTSSALVAWMRAHRVHTVEGNHEAWSRPEGRLAVLDQRQADPQLTPEARAWVDALPHEMEIFRPGGGGRVATMVHAHRDPTWRDVEAHDARTLVDRLGGPRLLLVGHTHRARLLRLHPGARRAEAEALDYRHETERVRPIPLEGTLVVDAGSVAEPSLRAVTQEHVPRATREAHATYAVVDLAAGTASVRALRKPGR